jgi:hypothetical protein
MIADASHQLLSELRHPVASTEGCPFTVASAFLKPIDYGVEPTWSLGIYTGFHRPMIQFLNVTSFKGCNVNQFCQCCRHIVLS